MQQLSIPYEQVEVAGRAAIRSDYRITSGGRTSYWVPFEEISVREGFNKRKDYGDDLEQLAQWIKDHGNKLPEPMLVDVLKDKRIQIIRGHRRREAVLLLISKGDFDPATPVEIFVNNTNVSEFEKMADQYLSNNGNKRFTILEAAEVAFSLKYQFGKELTDEQVAGSMGISRQTVTNYITIASQPDDVKQAIRSNDLTINAALEQIRAGKKAKKETEQKELDSHKTSTAPAQHNDLLKDEIKELSELTEQAAEYLKSQGNEALFKVADEVECTINELNKRIGYRLAAPACREWRDDFADILTGEISEIQGKQSILDANVMIDSETIEILILSGVKSVFIFKDKVIAPSVFTEPVAEREKGKYDLTRPELEKIQKAIQAGDKIEAIISKLDVPDQTKQDIAYQVHWLQENLEFVREWIHNNKRQNKMR